MKAQRAVHYEKYDTILKASIKVFARRGFFNSTVADVARQAGVADGTVYLYFKNKDDILVSIFNHVMDEVMDCINRELSQLKDPVARLRKIIKMHLELMENDADLAVVFQVELRHSIKFMEQFSATRVAEYLRVIRSVIEAGQKNGTIRRDVDSSIASKVLFGALDEMTTNWMLSKKKYPLASTADAIFQTFFRGIST
ncbi:MAG TPA: TetR/AcrR family transcriptional regulator [Acidobacteriota bacterium]|jgi:TetR/AcrR family fatty acid metabolism transcriptional regulator